MSLQTWEEALYASITTATQIASSVTETIMVPDTAIPAKYWYPGRTLKATLKGALSNVVTTPGTLTLRARYGGVAGTVLAASIAHTMSTTAQTGSQIWIEFLITCRANGWSATAGSLWTTGFAFLGESHGVTIGAGPPLMIPSEANAVVASLDLQSAGVLSFTAQFSVNGATTNLQIEQFLLEALN